MLGHSIRLPNPAQAPVRGLSGAMVAVRMLARAPASTEVPPSARQSRGWRCLPCRAAGTEPGAGWGEQPGSEGGRGQAAGMLRCQGRAGCRLSGKQQRTGIARGVPSSVWLPSVFVGALSSLVPSLGRTSTSRWHCRLPVTCASGRWYYPSISVLRMSLSKMHGGPSITFCPVCSLPTWGSPPCPGVPCISWKG